MITQKKLTLTKWAIMSTLVISLGVACKKTGEEAPTPTPTPPAGFVYIKGGTFQMGSPAGQGKPSEEQPQHHVTLDAFFMDTTELTREKFFEFLKSEDAGSIVNAFERKESYYTGSESKEPIANVHFNTALLYCNWRSKKEGLTQPYTFNTTNGTITYNKQANGYRLPTEAEWEYACRADTSVAKSPKEYFYGNDSTLLDQFAWFKKANSSEAIQNVATKKPNPFGLYDMHGNVSEWVWDWYSSTYDANDNKNPVGKSSGTERVYRGGSYKDWGESLRSAKRFKGGPVSRYEAVGIRLARNI